MGYGLKVIKMVMFTRTLIITRIVLLCVIIIIMALGNQDPIFKVLHMVNEDNNIDNVYLKNIN